MFGKTFDLFRIFGFTVRLDMSWFVVALLITWSLAKFHFPDVAPDQPVAVYWWMGVAGALGLFASVVVHELSHSLVARRFGLAIRGITLFIFGGVAEMEDEPPSARAEFWVAVAGPVASALISAACFVLASLVSAGGLHVTVTAVLSYLAAINLILVLFNLVPAFPLDGGRILRSVLWHTGGSLRRATRITSAIGSGFGLVLIFFGVLRVIAAQDLIGGMWMFLIGMFLRGAAQSSYQQLLVRNALEGEPVRRFMKSDPVTVPRAISVEELVESYVYKHHFKMFPVVDNGELLGCVTTREIKDVPREEWQSTSAGALAAPCTDENTTGPESDTMEALTKMSRSGASRLMVVDDGKLVGILALKDLLQFLSLKVELEGDSS